MIAIFRATLLTLILSSFVVPLAVKAQTPPTPPQPPKFVYRVDTRNPDDIFANGFKSWGNNDDIVAHILGTSCTRETELGGTHDSAFVATTTDQDIVRRAVAAYSTGLDPGDQVYVYEIRADNNFYSAQTSMALLRSQTFMTDRPQVPAQASVLGNGQSEWLAYQAVPGNQISSVSIHRVGASWQTTDVSNRGYRNLDTRGNASPYTPSTFSQVRRYVQAIVVQGVRTLSACFLRDRGDTPRVLFPVLVPLVSTQSDLH
jgi:hypothetical protein